MGTQGEAGGRSGQPRQPEQAAELPVSSDACSPEGAQGSLACRGARKHVASERAAARGAQARPITWRSIILGALIVVANNWWLTESEMRTQVTLLSGASPFIGVVFIMFVVTLTNWAIKRFYAPAALSQAELLVIYVMATISTCVGGVGAIGWFPAYLTTPSWNTINDPKWSKYSEFVPSWFGPRDESILRPFYEGHSTFFTLAHLRAWALPLALWGLFFFVLLSVTMCMMVLLRRPWVEHERLNFPIIYLPVEMTNMQSDSFFLNPVLWLGFVIPAIIHSLNSLNAIYPVIPTLRINKGYDLRTSVVTPPWSGIGWTPVKLHCSVVGIGYILALDVSFSCWVFYFLRKAIQIFGVATGLRSPDPALATEAHEFPYVGTLSIGAWVAVGLIALWGMRGHLIRVWRKAVWGEPVIDDSREPMSYRAALLVIVLGSLFLLAFCELSGMSVALPLLILGLFFIIMIALSRIRAESGVPASELMWVAPFHALINLGGSAAFSSKGLTTISLLAWFNKDYRTAAMPAQLEAFKIGELVRAPLRPIAVAMIVALLVAIPAAMIFSVNLYYTYGAGTGKTYINFVSAGGNNWDSLKGWVDNPEPARMGPIVAAASGALAVALLYWLRITFVGFPFTPSAFAFAMTYAIDFFWLDFIIAWILKGLILRYGGIKLYHKAMPLFLGLILGEFVTSSFWTIVGAASGLQLYRTFPN